MTNEEKAKELATRYTLYNSDADVNIVDIFGALKEMAEWKNQQLKEYLEKKILFLESQRKSWNKASNRYISFGIAILNLQSIINKLLEEKK